MIPWFMRDPERLKLERTGVEELSRTAKWIVGTEWSIGEDGLGLDAVICAKGHDYEVRVSFPTLYPDVPIIVRPKKMQSRISSHQYGDADGPLCLEWGPDNWHRDVTSTQMLESAYRLFEIENPLGEDRPEVPIIAPSRHKLTIGQELRRKWIRWFAGKTLYDYLAGQPSYSIGTFKFSLRQTGEIWICTVHEAMPFGGSVWVDDQIPTKLAGESELKTGIWLKTIFDKSTIGTPKTLTELRVLFEGMEGEKFLSTDGSSPVDAFGKSISGILISDKDEELNLFIVLKDEDVLECSRVRPGEEPIEIRSPDWDDINNKKVGIVGLGSVGSKIAISLARMGCRNFYLIDHDLLLPENLQRHAMDWQGVAQHKVDAMKFAIDLLAPGAKVGISRLHITGQESNAAINGSLNRLTSCDVIIDATANSKVFNLLAAITRVTLRPLIWMEVYGGGLGGMVARSRPKVDPTPQDMRGAYLQYCTDNPSPDFKPTSINYAVEDEEGEVLVASDADVAIIAHHAARLVPDCFTKQHLSVFPYSMYLIGLNKGWVFEAPFCTIPISMDRYSVEGWDNNKEQKFSSDDIQFLNDVIEKK